MKRLRFVLVCTIAFAIAAALGAQSKPSITRADYGQFETLGVAGARGGFSPDGRFLAYTINRSDRTSELRVAKIADGSTVVTAPFGAQAVYSTDSKWLAYSVGVSEAEQERLRASQRPMADSALAVHPVAVA